MPADEFQDSGFNWEMQKFFQRVGEGFEGLFNRAPNLPTTEPPPSWVSQLFFWVILAGMALLAGRWLYLLLRPYVHPFLNSIFSSPQVRATQAAPPVAIADWLARSRQAQQKGHYGEACRALYMAALHHLDQQNLIPLDSSRTDGEYLRLTGQLDRPIPYQTLIRTHERLCFGQATISAEECDRCWQAYKDLDRP